MKKYLLASILLPLLLIVPLFPAAGGNWYAGGTLHKATVGQWKAASEENRLATAADWAFSNAKVKEQVQKTGSPATLRPFAVQLMQCVNKAAAVQGYDNASAAEFASICIAFMW